MGGGCCSTTSKEDIKRARESLNKGTNDDKGKKKPSLAPEGVKSTPLKRGPMRLTEPESLQDLEKQFFDALMA